MLIRLFYISEISDSVTDIDVQIILGAAQMNNRRLDVTGMLAKSDGHFAQVLEGRTEVVAPLTAKILLDKRHRAVRFLLEESTSTREFARWSMGLVQRDDMREEMQKLHREGCPSDDEARRLIKVLMAYAD